MGARSESKPRLYAAILAGGRGTRFWPRSRKQSPKQLMALYGSDTLLQQTVERLQPLIAPKDVWIFTNETLLDQVIRQLPEVPPSQIIAEPVQRNTGPCVGLAAELIAAKDPNAILGVFPSDQAIAKPGTFRRVIRLAAKQAEQGKIVVLGIAPRWPETGYGYMEFPRRPSGRKLEAIPIRRFCEKPQLKIARRYVRARRFYWNSGMFFWKASTVLEELRNHLPQTAAVLSKIGAAYREGDGANSDFVTALLRNQYPACENISIDYAVLEKAGGVVGIPCDMGWSDLGSWNAIYDLLSGDDGHANVLRTPALIRDSTGLYVDAPGKLVAAIGVDDLAIVDSPDAILIVRRDRSQDVSQLVKELERFGRDDLL